MDKDDLYMCRRALQCYVYDIEEALKKRPDKYEDYKHNYNQAKKTLIKIEGELCQD